MEEQWELRSMAMAGGSPGVSGTALTLFKSMGTGLTEGCRALTLAGEQLLRRYNVVAFVSFLV